MSFIKLFLFLLIFTPLSLLHAQADSLLTVYQTAKTSKDKLNALLNLAAFNVLTQSDPVQGERYTQMLIADAKKYADTAKLIAAYDLLGNSKRINNKPIESFEFFEKALALARQVKNYSGAALILNNISLSHKDLGNVASVFESLENALDASQKCDCPMAKIVNMTNLSMFYSDAINDKVSALYWVKEGNKFTSSIPEANRIARGQIKFNLALLFFQTGQIDSAIFYNRLALSYAGQYNDKRTLIYIHALESKIALFQQNLKKAIEEAQKAYTLAQLADDSVLKLVGLNPLVAALLSTQQEGADKRSELMMMREKYLKELTMVLNDSLVLISPVDVNEGYDNLFKAFVNNDPQRAATYLKKQKVLQDSVNQKAIKSRADIFAAKSGMVLKESENKRLQLEQEKIQQRNRFLLIGLVLASIAVANLIYLYQKLRYKNTSLNDLNAALAKSNTQMERFTHTLSHDALGYINHILNYARAGQEADTLEEGHYNALKTHRYATNLKKMAQNLIQFNKMGFDAQPETVVLSELVEEVSQDMNGDLATNNVTLNNLTAETLVLTDRELLKQVLRNLTHNAVKFRRPDVPLVLDIKAVEKGNWIEVSIADNGIGIAPQQLSLVFNEFTKLDKRAEGSGLGLFISKQIMERLGGQIWVKSIMGQGSTFYFTLPKTDNTTPQ